MRAEPFTLCVTDSLLYDLRDRLRRTRWPVEPATPPGSMARAWSTCDAPSPTGPTSTTGDVRRLRHDGSAAGLAYVQMKQERTP
jgi:hypothetical protein